jgi:hypothetical protein
MKYNFATWGNFLCPVLTVVSAGAVIFIANQSQAQDFIPQTSGEITGAFVDDFPGSNGFSGSAIRALEPGEDNIGSPIEFDSLGAGSNRRFFVGQSAIQKSASNSDGMPVEIFDPLTTHGDGKSLGNTGDANDWVTPEGRINLKRRDPETQLWAPAPNGGGQWSDGPIGLQIGIDGLFFTRGLNGSAPFATNTAGQTFRISDLELDVESTIRYRLAIASEYGTGYEFVAYDLDEFSGTLSLTGEGITPTFFGGNPADPAESYTTTYRSRIRNYELNIWARRSESLRVGYGLRHFSIDEQFDITNDPVDPANSTPPGGGGVPGPVQTSGFFSSTDNTLFGGQIMVEFFRKFTSSAYLTGGVKGLLLSNRADLEINTANINLSGDDSFVTGGLNFHGGVSFRPFRGVNLQAGYEGVYLGSVASGSAQSENNNVFTGAVGPVGEGLYYGGGYAGCTITF